MNFKLFSLILSVGTAFASGAFAQEKSGASSCKTVELGRAKVVKKCNLREIRRVDVVCIAFDDRRIEDFTDLVLTRAKEGCGDKFFVAEGFHGE